MRISSLITLYRSFSLSCLKTTSFNIETSFNISVVQWLVPSIQVPAQVSNPGTSLASSMTLENYLTSHLANGTNAGTNSIIGVWYHLQELKCKAFSTVPNI